MLVFYLPQCYPTIIPYKLDVRTFFVRRYTLMDVVGIKGDRSFCRKGDRRSSSRTCIPVG
ncbi:MAG: hypothetical protein U7126_07400 [Microcoleus sp.]